MSLHRLWIVVLIVMLALVACGSDDEDSNNSESNTSATAETPTNNDSTDADLTDTDTEDTDSQNADDSSAQTDGSAQTQTTIPYGPPVTLEQTLGQGQKTRVVWSADSSVVAVTGTAGVWLWNGEEAHFFTGQNDWIGALAFEDDSTRVVSTSTGSSRDVTFDFVATVTVWDRDSFEMGVQMQPDEGNILELDFSPDGTTIAGGGTDSKLYIWDAATGDRVQVFEEHGETVRTLAYSPDGTLVATGSNDDIARLFNLDTEEVTALEGHANDVVGVLFLNEGAQLLTLDIDRQAIVWDVATGEQVRTFEYPCSASPCDFILADDGQLYTHTGQYTNFVDMETGERTDGKNGVFSPDGSKYVYPNEGKIEVQDVTARETLYEGDYAAIYTDLASHGDLLAAAPTSPNANIRLYDLTTFDYTLVEPSGGTYDYRPVSISPDGTLVASIEARNKVAVYDLNGEDQQLIEAHTGYVFDVAFSPDGQYLASGAREDENAMITRIWSTEDYSEVAALNHEHLGDDWRGRAQLVFSPDSSRLITVYGNRASVLSVWDMETFELINSVTIDNGEYGRVVDLAFTPDGATLIAAGGTGSTFGIGEDMQRGGRVLFLNGETLEIEQAFDNMVHDFAVAAVDISADGTRMITVGRTTPSGAVWDVATRTMISTFKLPRPGEDAVFLGDSNTRFATVGEDRAVSIWRLEDGTETEAAATTTRPLG